jgi:hypothetical protein
MSSSLILDYMHYLTHDRNIQDSEVLMNLDMRTLQFFFLLHANKVGLQYGVSFFEQLIVTQVSISYLRE